LPHCHLHGLIMRFQNPLVICRAASTRIFLKYFEDIDLAAVLESMGASLTIACPVNHELDSIHQIQRLVTGIANKANFLVVRNEAHGEGFDLFDKSKVRQKLLNELGAKEILVTQMYKWLVEDLQRFKVTPTVAVKGSDFTIMDRQRLLNWQRLFYEQLDSVKEMLLPGVAEKGKSAHATA
jgi:hypothetical protein